jgi:hypothetical protein
MSTGDAGWWREHVLDWEHRLRQARAALADANSDDARVKYLGDVREIQDHLCRIRGLRDRCLS